ncbi:hypothetical protein PVAP13_5NG584150 [Panicum virgatum]|uniref:Uncharacterized protein n=1 Tax=Panicum virgatum TaxID=38727 RepID=A0A8T0S8Q9_PANVG|nr:hypothetical protein PVAP13_5NG584150 [Panicum virgatum]
MSSSCAAPPFVSVWASRRASRFVSPRRRRLGLPPPPSTASSGRRRPPPPPSCHHHLPRVAAPLRHLGAALAATGTRSAYINAAKLALADAGIP